MASPMKSLPGIITLFSSQPDYNYACPAVRLMVWNGLVMKDCGKRGVAVLPPKRANGSRPPHSVAEVRGKEGGVMAMTTTMAATRRRRVEEEEEEEA
mmetsp:Transcript_10125/g.24934  ORF Transcript_10125/g.24934 Transcript_10125/m.24934 type:complete len:97 (+) Transcript_10125:238-528(+)